MVELSRDDSILKEVRNQRIPWTINSYGIPLIFDVGFIYVYQYPTETGIKS